jgi:acetyl esterase/lipase
MRIDGGRKRGHLLEQEQRTLIESAVTYTAPEKLVIVEHDPLRDDGLAFAERLLAAGVPVQLHRGTGLIHGYLRALSYAGSARAAFE